MNIRRSLIITILVLLEIQSICLAIVGCQNRKSEIGIGDGSDGERIDGFLDKYFDTNAVDESKLEDDSDKYHGTIEKKNGNEGGNDPTIEAGMDIIGESKSDEEKNETEISEEWKGNPNEIVLLNEKLFSNIHQADEVENFYIETTPYYQDYWPVYKLRDDIWFHYEIDERDYYFGKRIGLNNTYDPIEAAENISFAHYIGSGFYYDEYCGKIYLSDQDVSDRFIQMDQAIIGAGKDTTGITVWVIDTNVFDSESFIYAKDGKGNIKKLWGFDNIANKYPNLYLNDFTSGIIMTYDGGSIYHWSSEMGTLAFNIENGVEYAIKPKLPGFNYGWNGLFSKEENIGWNHGWDGLFFQDDKYVGWIEPGHEEGYNIFYVDSGKPASNYILEMIKPERYCGSGLLAYTKDGQNSVCDIETGKKCFDIEDTDKGPFFCGDYGAISFKDQTGNYVTTIIDKLGNRLTKPVGGKIVDCMNELPHHNFVIERDGNSYYLMDNQGNIKEINQNQNAFFVNDYSIYLIELSHEPAYCILKKLTF